MPEGRVHLESGISDEIGVDETAMAREISTLSSRSAQLRSAVVAIVLGTLLSCAGTPTGGSGDRPNVIVILTDDQGYGDLSAHGNPILKTPNLDSLRAESIRFDDFHVAPVCTPTRGELMTGLYALRNKAGMVPAGRNLMRRDITTMPEVFAASGYTTGLFGKWHLGDTYPHRPLDRGFQRAVWHKGWGLASEIEYDNDYYYTRYLDQTEVRYSDRFCTNLWFDNAMEWMGQQASAGQPFFAYISLNTPHSPFHALAKDFAGYGDKVADPLLAHFYGLIHNIDENFARLDNWLRETGIRDNTLVVLMNDNGTSKGETVFNAGMRGKKGSAYDGGHRAICFIRWPGGDLGDPRTIDHTAHITDILPTLADMLNLTVPASTNFDGHSLKQLLTGAAEQGPDRKLIVQYGGRIRPAKYVGGAVLWNQWRLVEGSELYDIDSDPGQATDVAEQHPEIVAAMKAHYDEYWAEIEASVAEVEPLFVRSDPGLFTDLTSNSWIEVDCDNRTRTAEACGPPRGGPWQIEVEQDGGYYVDLSRWPFHLDRSMTIKGPASTIGGMPISQGTALPIASASLSLNDAAPVTVHSEQHAASIRFELSLKQGRNTLQGWFSDASGKDLAGAYYGRVLAK